MGNHKKPELLSENFASKLLPKANNANGVSLSVIIPIYNCSESLGRTLDGIVQQKYELIEVIVIDAGSTDRSLEVISGYGPLVNRIYSVTDYHLADMWNRGISLTSGKYITFLFPGSVYLSPITFQTFADGVYAGDFPELVYCGCIQKEIKREPKTMLYPFKRQILEKGQAFTCVSACWFRRDVFDKIGRFNTNYEHRFCFELFCRLVKEESLKKLKLERIFVEFDLGYFGYGKALRAAMETVFILCRQFGLRKGILWSLSINHLLLFKWVWDSFKYHLSR